MTLQFDGTFHRATPGGFVLSAAFVTDGQVTAVCGPSGSGKTTLVHLLAGLLTPRAGRIVLKNQVLFDAAIGLCLPPERRNLGVVFQDSLLFPHLTVSENVRFGLERSQVALPAVPAPGDAGHPITFERVVTVLELQELMERRPATLSGGQARRVALGRALLRRPALLVLDEPFTGLDDELKEKIVVYLERVRDEWQLPMILVSHDRAAVSRLATQVLELRAGRLATTSTTISAATSAVGHAPAAPDRS